MRVFKRVHYTMPYFNINIFKIPNQIYMPVYKYPYTYNKYDYNKYDYNDYNKYDYESDNYIQLAVNS